MKGRAEVFLEVAQEWGGYLYYSLEGGESRQCGSGQYCRWDQRIGGSICEPRDPCPSITHNMQVPW